MSGPDDTTRLLTEIRDLLRELSSSQRVDADLRRRVMRRMQRLILLLVFFLGLYLAYSFWWYARYGSGRHS